MRKRDALKPGRVTRYVLEIRAGTRWVVAARGTKKHVKGVQKCRTDKAPHRFVIETITISVTRKVL